MFRIYSVWLYVLKAPIVVTITPSFILGSKVDCPGIFYFAAENRGGKEGSGDDVSHKIRARIKTSCLPGIEIFNHQERIVGLQRVTIRQSYIFRVISVPLP